LTTGASYLFDAAFVDRVEDRLMPPGDGGAAGVVLAADVHELRVLGERCSESLPVGIVPSVLQLVQDAICDLGGTFRACSLLS
jgi:hypothetical protein